MAFTPLEMEKPDILHFQFAWQSSNPPETYEEFKEGIGRRSKSALKI
ncbi:hypothetical protein [Heyndrickxia oleronia]|nr:hypothetical protein [Heyndrickxia oleronia]